MKIGFKMKKLSIKTYPVQIQRPELPEAQVKLAFLTDFHNLRDTKTRGEILKGLDAYGPDLILVGGDMPVGKPAAGTGPALSFMREVVKRGDVYYAFGNHECRMCLYPEIYGNIGLQYEKALLKLGVHLLRNEKACINIKGLPVCVLGLEIPAENYRKMKRIKYTSLNIEEVFGIPQKDCVQILLAHNPVYADAYMDWGADLTLSGHMHGGIMRLFGHPVIGTDGRLFPRYGYGRFEKKGRVMLVGAGLGEHTIPLRIFNPRELVFAELNINSAK